MASGLNVVTWDPVGTTRGTVLLLHGSESHSGWFAEVGTKLAAGGLQAVAFDRTGWGKSQGARGAVKNAQAVISEVKAQADLLGRPLHLAGLSWGGLLAAATAARFATSFQSLTLIAPALFRLRTPSLLDLARAAVGLGDVKLPIRPEDFTRDPERLAFIRGDKLRVESVNFGFCLATVAMERAARSAFPAVKSRILLAERDDLIDNERTRIWAARRGVEFKTLPGTLHSLVMEAPDAVAREILDVTRAP